MRPLRVAAVATAALAALAFATSCGDDNGGTNNGGGGGGGAAPVTTTVPATTTPVTFVPTTTTPPVQPAAYTLKYDQSGCQVFQGPGLLDVPGVYCVRKASDNPDAWDFFLRGTFVASATPTALFRQEYGTANAGYDVRRYYPNGIWLRSPVGRPSAIEYCWRVSTEQACTWASPQAYQQLSDQKLASEQAAQAKASQQAAQQAQQNNTQQAQNLLYDINMREIEMGKLWLQPACNSSYNGCR